MYQDLSSFFVGILGTSDLTTALTVLIYCAFPLVIILLYALLAILAEMKISAWVQDRLGPMRTGPYGVLQPLADILKLLQKEDLTPTTAGRIRAFP